MLNAGFARHYRFSRTSNLAYFPPCYRNSLAKSHFNCVFVVGGSLMMRMTEKSVLAASSGICNIPKMFDLTWNTD